MTLLQGSEAQLIRNDFFEYVDPDFVCQFKAFLVGIFVRSHIGAVHRFNLARFLDVTFLDSSHASASGPQIPGVNTTSGDCIYTEPGGGIASNVDLGNAATLSGNVSVTGTLTVARTWISDPRGRRLHDCRSGMA